MHSVKVLIVAAGDFLTNISPFFPFLNANKTKSIASFILIKNLVIFKFVTVKVFFLKNLMNKGITDPLEYITFPYRVIQIFVLFDILDFDTITFSIIDFEHPLH